MNTKSFYPLVYFLHAPPNSGKSWLVKNGPVYKTGFCQTFFYDTDELYADLPLAVGQWWTGGNADIIHAAHAYACIEKAIMLCIQLSRCATTFGRDDCICMVGNFSSQLLFELEAARFHLLLFTPPGHILDRNGKLAVDKDPSLALPIEWTSTIERAVEAYGPNVNLIVRVDHFDEISIMLSSSMGSCTYKQLSELPRTMLNVTRLEGYRDKIPITAFPLARAFPRSTTLDTLDFDPANVFEAVVYGTYRSALRKRLAPWLIRVGTIHQIDNADRAHDLVDRLNTTMIGLVDGSGGAGDLSRRCVSPQVGPYPDDHVSALKRRLRIIMTLNPGL